MTPRRAAFYARVSTDDKGQSPDNQLVDLRRFAAAQNWPVVAEYVDYDSGSKSARVQLKAMLDSASRREFDVLVFWSLDRLSREGALKTLQILNQLAGWGVAYRSYTEPTWTPSDPSVTRLLQCWQRWPNRRGPESRNG